MSTKNKLYKFKENETFAALLQPTTEELLGKDYKFKGRWGRLFLGMTTLLFWNWVAVRVNIPCNLQSSLLRRISLV